MKHHEEVNSRNVESRMQTIAGRPVDVIASQPTLEFALIILGWTTVGHSDGESKEKKTRRQRSDCGRRRKRERSLTSAIEIRKHLKKTVGEGGQEGRGASRRWRGKVEGWFYIDQSIEQIFERGFRDRRGDGRSFLLDEALTRQLARSLLLFPAHPKHRYRTRGTLERALIDTW
jgi:hypothetical protein